MLVTIFVFLISYLEWVFMFSTSRQITLLSFAVVHLCALAYGCFLAAVLTFIRNDRIRHAVSVGLLILIPLLYVIEFLIYRTFKVFYDVNTIFNGAGGVLSGFMGDVFRTIISADTPWRLALFIAPLIIYIVLLIIGHRSERMSRALCCVTENAAKRAAAIGLLLIILAVCLSESSTIHKLILSEEYNFQTAVEQFGFLTGVGLDVQKTVSGEDIGEFLITENNNSQATGTTTGKSVALAETETETGSVAKTGSKSGAKADIDNKRASGEKKDVPVEYGFNAYNLDYEAISETASGINAELDHYVASLTPSRQNEYTGMFAGKNLIMITAEAFSGALVSEELTPTLYRLIHNGIYFEDFYQPAIAGTIGGEYSNIFGLLPTKGGKSMRTLTAGNPFLNMGHQLDLRGYYGKTYHNNSSTVYSRNVTHNQLGYSDGFMGVGDGMEDYLLTRGFPASDREMIEGTFPTYVNKQPFNIYYMTVSGHGQYGRSINQMSCKNYDRVKELPYSEIVKCYLANNLELEDAMTSLLKLLTDAGIEDDTVICISPDHFPYDLDKGANLGNMPNLSELYGYSVKTYFDRDKTSCVLWSGCLEDMDPITVSSPTFSLDLLPTLSNLFGVEFDSRLLPGRDVLSDSPALIFDGAYDWKTDLGTYISSRNTFTPVSESTFIPEDYVDIIKIEVRNKINFCKGVLSEDFYGHIYKQLYPEVEENDIKD